MGDLLALSRSTSSQNTAMKGEKMPLHVIGVLYLLSVTRWTIVRTTEGHSVTVF